MVSLRCRDGTWVNFYEPFVREYGDEGAYQLTAGAGPVRALPGWPPALLVFCMVPQQGPGLNGCRRRD